MTEFGISPVAEVFVKISTFVVSYTLVGFLFSFDKEFEGKGKAMSIAYFVISTLLGFGLSIAIMFLEQNIVTIFWIMISVVVIIGLAAGSYYLSKFIKSKKNQEV
jgi:Na+-driven multidrug efflux pump